MSTEPTFKTPCGHTFADLYATPGAPGGIHCRGCERATDAAQTEPARPDCEMWSSPESVLAFDAELNPEPDEFVADRTGRLTAEQFWLEWIRGKGKRLAEKSLSEINCEFATAFRDASEAELRKREPAE